MPGGTLSWTDRLDERLRSRRSQAPPVERVWLDKDDGKQRLIGKPTCEDKIVQRAVVMLWEVIDAQDFCDSRTAFDRAQSS